MIKFTKMEGLGNDYVYMDAINQKIENRSELARFVSNRNFGIGSDGLILIERSEVTDFKMTMFNSDGSQAEMCGNGIRCVAKFVYDKGMTDKTTLKIETLAGIKILELNVEDGKVKTVRVDMGEPILEAEKVPVVSIVKDTSKFDVKKYGEELEVNKAFPRRTNVEFVQIIDRNTIKMRVWERGAGETLACGTGACATAVACNLNGLTDRKVTIELLGGNLEIEWNKENNHVYMTGPATTVFEGELIEQGGIL